jgi:hypothetical protein
LRAAPLSEGIGMYSTPRYAPAVALVLCCALPLAANPVVAPGWERRPPFAPPVRVSAPFTVKGTNALAQARLILPRKLFENLQEALAPNPGQAGEVNGFQVDLRTVVAGLALSAAVVCVGLRLASSRRRLAFAGATALLASLAVLGTGCPPREQFITPDIYQATPLTRTPDNKLVGTVAVELADGDDVVVDAPRETMAGFLIGSGMKTEPAR